MQKCIKIISVLILLVMGFTSCSLAEAFSYTNELKKDYITGDTTNGVTTATKNVMGTILKVVRTVAIGIAVIMLTYIAIKYMSAAPNEKAEFKKSATAYIVGAIVLFATSGILSIIQNFVKGNL